MQLSAQPSGPWGDALAQIEDWDPELAARWWAMTADPWCTGILPRKFVELVCVAFNAACTNLNPDGTRRHIRAALDAGASRDEILTVFKLASMIAIHSCNLGAPILLEEAEKSGAALNPDNSVTPVCDAMRAAGQWNPAWDAFAELDRAWTERYMSVSAYGDAVFSAKEIELLWIAFDASYTHMYATGLRRHVAAALAAGATVPEIMDVLKLCVAQGVQSCNLGVPILAEELQLREAR